MPVTRFNPITQSDFAALALLANTRANLAGRPYNFNAPPTWWPPNAVWDIWTELARLRQNLYAQFQWFNSSSGGGGVYNYFENFPGKPSMLLSGPYTANFGGSGAGVLRTVAVDGEVDGAYSIYAKIPVMSEQKYIFSRTPGTVTTVADFGGFNKLFPLILYSRNADPDPVAAQLLKIQCDLDGFPFDFDFRFYFTAVISAAALPVSTLELFGADAAEFTLTIISITPSGGGQHVISAEITRAETGLAEDFSFEVGVRDTTASTTQNIRSINYGGLATATLTNIASVTIPWPVIDNQSAGQALLLPSMSALKVTHKDVDANDIYISGTDKMCGNQAAITITPDNPNEGVWLGKTMPVSGLYFFQALANGSGFNPFARFPTVGDLPSRPTVYPFIPDQPAIAWSPNACDFITPSYPVARVGEPAIVPRGADISGALITGVFVSRKVTANSDGLGELPTGALPALEIELGNLRSGAFQRFQTIHLPANTVSKWFDTQIVASTLVNDQTFPLYYRCAESLRIEASVQGCFAAGKLSGELVAANNASGTGMIPTQPYLAPHFNDTESLLLLLP